MNPAQRTSLAWLLVALFAVVTLIRALLPTLLPAALLSALVMGLPLCFFVVHGSLGYRPRDLLVFAATTLVVSNGFENMSVLTGFPFGNYVYTDTLGPKLFHVPVLIGPAYLGTGYLAWTIAGVIAGASGGRLSGHRTWSVPLLASWMMVAWDLTVDPIFSTIYHSWIWRDGGSYFGVPFSNFLGWLLTTFVFLQLFALYLRGQPRVPATGRRRARAMGLQAILFYGLIAAGYLLSGPTRETSATVTDAMGMVWRVQDIYAVSGLMALFTMGAFTVLGLVRLLEVAPVDERATGVAAESSAAPYRAERRVDDAIRRTAADM